MRQRRIHQAFPRGRRGRDGPARADQRELPELRGMGRKLRGDLQSADRKRRADGDGGAYRHACLPEEIQSGISGQTDSGHAVAGAAEGPAAGKAGIQRHDYHRRQPHGGFPVRHGPEKIRALLHRSRMRHAAVQQGLRGRPGVHEGRIRAGDPVRRTAGGSGDPDSGGQGRAEAA